MRLTLSDLRRSSASRKIAMLTCYDASFAAVMDRAGVDSLLIGDSLGMVVQGHDSTLPVSVDDIAYHTAAVVRGSQRAFVVADMPFGSYQGGGAQALANAVRLMQAGAHMVKLEGGGWTAPVVRFLVERGVPVCAHLGLTPQSVHRLGGYRVQGRDAAAAQALRDHALELAAVGADIVLFELVPSALARSLTAELPVPTIGIGAGSGCSGQVLVLYDMLGLGVGEAPRFVRNFLAEGGGLAAAVRRYVDDVKSGRYPDDAVHGY